MRTFIALCLTAAWGLADAGSPIYKWVDADGNLHFSDCPPEPAENCVVEEVTVAPGPALSEEELRRIEDRRAELIRELDQVAEARERRQEKRREKRTARTQDAEFRQRQCVLARDNLEELLRAEPVYRLEGRSRAVEQREDETLEDIETIRALIGEYCDD